MKAVSFENGVMKENIVDPKSLLGEAVTIQLKNGKAFYFKVMGHREETENIKESIFGFNVEILTMTIAVNDIDFIIRS